MMAFLKSYRELSFFMVWVNKGDHTSAELKDIYDSSIVLTRENFNCGSVSFPFGMMALLCLFSSNFI
jgi:3-isopropylmalate dehydratase small subunit